MKSCDFCLPADQAGFVISGRVILSALVFPGFEYFNKFNRINRRLPLLEKKPAEG